uniref:t-SNARE coiled-coil homology domain-containing protein n=1 Tax=Noctiluca scintillans TaxID=2966 RepID=A0A7S1FCF5_NOCSC
MVGPPPISRNLTPIYVRYRNERRGGSRARGGALLLGNDGQRLLGGDPDPLAPDVTIEMTSLPPQWMESAEECREDIKKIRDKLVQLTKYQQRRLLKVFGDDEAPDKEVETVTNQISVLVRKCEQNIGQVKTRGAKNGVSSEDSDLRQNMQRSLATQLQQLSQQFRASQKEYLNDIRKRQRGSVWDASSSSGGGRAAIGGSPVDMGFSDMQLLELTDMEDNASQRSDEICQIASSITDLHTIFKELAVLVIDQGSILDRIDYNIEQVVEQSKAANVQLTKAEKSQKSNRATKCMLCLVLVNVILILILVVKARH